MTDPSTDELLFLPPVPLATGGMLDDEETGQAQRIARVELVVTTEDGGELRIPLVFRHGAWWAP